MKSKNSSNVKIKFLQNSYSKKKKVSHISVIDNTATERVGDKCWLSD